LNVGRRVLPRRHAAHAGEAAPRDREGRPRGRCVRADSEGARWLPSHAASDTCS
jgi:hypothetical protein